MTAKRLGAVLVATALAARLGAQGDRLIHFDRVLLLETTAETSANVHSPAADKTYSGNLVDLDGDRDLDVVISNDTPDPKRVYLNDGHGKFREAGTYGRPEWSTRNAAVADVNGDALPDIIVANRQPPGKGANYICLNRGKGRFDSECTAFAEASATTITAADFNGDGLPDLAVPHRDGGQSHLYINQSTRDALRFKAVPFGPAKATIRVSAAADLNADGRLDLVAIDERAGVFVFHGAADATFSSGVPIGARGPGKGHASRPVASRVFEGGEFMVNRRHL